MKKFFVLFILFIQKILLAQGTDSLFSKTNSNSQEISIRSTEIHFGLGIQNLFFGGFRQKISDDFLLEANLGYLSWPTFFEYYTYGIGISWIPVSTQRSPGFFGSLLFSEWADSSLFRSKFISYRILTINVGYLIQHNEGLSFLCRAGIGIQQQNSEIYDYELGQNSVQIHKYLAWINFEITMGFAF